MNDHLLESNQIMSNDNQINRSLSNIIKSSHFDTMCAIKDVNMQLKKIRARRTYDSLCPSAPTWFGMSLLILAITLMIYVIFDATN